MDNNIDNRYINNAIDELIKLLGIKEEVPIHKILSPFDRGKVKESIETIANYLGLPIVVNLSYVPATYERRTSGNRFESSALATTDSTGRGVGGIAAQVHIPSYLPLYGTSALQKFPISVKISDNCRRYPQAFVAVMAHELSHIVLHSLWHKEKDNEFYTDLTAMILGFPNVMRNGRKVVETREKFMSTETLTTTYGYLSDEKFDFAFKRISEIRQKAIDSKKRLFDKVTTYRKQCSSYKRELFKFNKFVEYLDKNQSKRIRREDGARIVLFHQLNYTGKFTAVIRSNEEKLKEINDFCVGLLHYTQQRLNSLGKFDEEIDALISDLKREFGLLDNNVSTLRKYVGFIYKFKINRQATLYEKSLRS